MFGENFNISANPVLPRKPFESHMDVWWEEGKRSGKEREGEGERSQDGVKEEAGDYKIPEMNAAEDGSRKRKREDTGEERKEGRREERREEENVLLAGNPGVSPVEEVFFYFLFHNACRIQERERERGEVLSADVLKAIDSVKKLRSDWEDHVFHHIASLHSYSISPFCASSSGEKDILSIKFVEDLTSSRGKALISFQLWRKVNKLFTDWRVFLKRNEGWFGHSQFIACAEQAMVVLHTVSLLSLFFTLSFPGPQCPHF